MLVRVRIGKVRLRLSGAHATEARSPSCSHEKKACHSLTLMVTPPEPSSMIAGCPREAVLATAKKKKKQDRCPRTHCTEYHVRSQIKAPGVELATWLPNQS